MASSSNSKEENCAGASGGSGAITTASTSAAEDSHHIHDPFCGKGSMSTLDQFVAKQHEDNISSSSSTSSRSNDEKRLSIERLSIREGAELSSNEEDELNSGPSNIDLVVSKLYLGT